MNRRDLISLLGGAAAWPLAAGAQQPAVPVVGFLGAASAQGYATQVAGFRQGLQDAGFNESQVAIEYRWAEGQNDRLPALAADLVRRQVSVIAVLGSTVGTQAAKAATATIPIVFQLGSDPVEVGLVATLKRPGGNLTGVTTLSEEVAPKRLELLHELVPTATSIGVLVNPANPTVAYNSYTTSLQAAARTLGLNLHVVHASAESDFDAAFATLAQLRAGGLVINGDALFTGRSERLAELALRHAVPTIFQYREFAAAGGLMSFGGSITDAYHQVGVYTGRILRGEKPADLPVQQATKVELIINLKTAKTLDLTVPLSLLGRADEVIE
jgi:putative ABC transport system substrate-binding protein